MQKYTALDVDPARLDEHERGFVDIVRKHGWHVTSVAGDRGGPGFCYTTGFWLKFKFPELIVFSLRPKIAHDTFWHMYRTLESGKSFPIGEPTHDIFHNVTAVLLPVTRQQYPSHLGWSGWFYGNDDFECLQLVWPELDGKYPWSAGAFEDTKIAQPNLTARNWSG